MPNFKSTVIAPIDDQRLLFGCLLCNIIYLIIIYPFHYFHYEMFVSVPPQIAPFDFGEEASNVGEVAMVVCMVTKGDLPLDIFWSLNKEPILSGVNGFKVLRMNARTSTLSVDSLDAIHRGLYNCVARNAAGFVEYHADLRVNGYCAQIIQE